MGCCTSKEPAREGTTPYANAPCTPIASRDPAPSSQPPISSPYDRGSTSIHSSLAPATDTGLDSSSRTNIIQPPRSPSHSPLPPRAICSSSPSPHPDELSPPSSTSKRSTTHRRSLFARTSTASPTAHASRSFSSSTPIPINDAERPNAPLRAPSPVPVSPRKSHIPDALQPRRPWTRRVLAQQRAEFFDTQTGGRAEAWAVVRWVCEAMTEAGTVGSETGQRRDFEDEDGDGMEGGGQGGGNDGLAAAQGIMDAAGLTCPTGRLADGVYDAQGNRYVVPAWVVRDPEDVIKDEEEDGRAGKLEEEKVRVEKGKGRMVEEDEGEKRLVTVRIRRSDPETNYKIRTGKGQSVGMLIECFREEAELPTDAKIRIFFLGRQMSESKSLSTQTEGRWRDGDVVIAFVSQR
ncbi:MAG: hypothetical protein M1822_003974 [Bathelium mastoideum]|nr:MAG: hypothetical protein M1822_003974 [Bathelium mastoideum]